MAKNIAKQKQPIKSNKDDMQDAKNFLKVAERMGMDQQLLARSIIDDASWYNGFRQLNFSYNKLQNIAKHCTEVIQELEHARFRNYKYEGLVSVHYKGKEEHKVQAIKTNVRKLDQLIEDEVFPPTYTYTRLLNAIKTPHRMLKPGQNWRSYAYNKSTSFERNVFPRVLNYTEKQIAEYENLPYFSQMREALNDILLLKHKPEPFPSGPNFQVQKTSSKTYVDNSETLDQLALRESSS